eukprot:gene6437-9330_t
MKTFLVTGGNRGIGLSICSALVQASADHFVWVGCRDVERSKEQLSRKGSLLESEAEWNARVNLLPLDVTDDDSITSAVKILRDRNVTLDVLINNAGVALDLPWVPQPFTEEACTTTLEVNIRGVQRVFHAMKELLAPDARVINVSSGAGPLNMQKMSIEKQQTLLADELTEDIVNLLVDEFEEEYKQVVRDSRKDKVALPCAAPSGWWLQAYGFSKAIENALTRIWARDNPELLVTCCTPGMVDTGMTAGYTGSTKKKTPDEGAETPLWLALASRDAIENGRMYGNSLALLPWIGYQS